MTLLGTLLHLFIRFGYAAVFLGVMAENAGVPLPGETILLAAAFFASQGHFSLGLVILVAAVGAMVGDNVGYALGAKVARPFLIRRGRFLVLTPTRLRAIEAFFQRHGDKTILFARFVSGLRVVAALFAGLSGMHWRIFVLYNAAGAFLWAAGVGLLGYFFGASWNLLEKWVGLGGLVALGVIVLAVLLVALLKHARAIQHSLTAIVPKALGRREGFVILANLTALALFSKVTEDVVSGEATGFDRFLLVALHPHSGSVVTAALLAGSALGSAPAIIVVVIVATALLFRWGARREAIALIAATATAEAITLILLYTVQRAHPGLWEALLHVHRYSFPSGDTLVSTATYGMVGYLVGRLRPAFKWPAYTGAGVIILAVGVCRVALGVNWPTDVLAAFAAGLLILWTTIYVYEGNYGVVLRAVALLKGNDPKAPDGGEGNPPTKSVDDQRSSDRRDDGP